MEIPWPPRAPGYQLTIDGTPVLLGKRLASLTLTDKRGLEADELDIDLIDHDGLLAIPRRGVEISLSLGWSGNLIDRGTYIVDEVEHTGPPDHLTIRAKSADLTAQGSGEGQGQGGLTRKRDQSYHDTTLGAIVEEIAGRHGLSAAVSPKLQGTTIQHEDQTKESDVALLTRLAEQHGAIATIKAGKLIFTPPGEGSSASGQPMEAAILRRVDTSSHRYSISEREDYQGVIAEWQDSANAEKKKVKVGEGEDSEAKLLRVVYATEAAARSAAEAELQRLKQGTATLELDLPLGRADLAPETPLTLTGFKPEIDAHKWICTEAKHTLDGQGYRTSLNAEAPGADT